MTWISLPLGWLATMSVKEGDKLGRGMALCRAPQYFSSLGVERGIQRQRAVPEVLEALALGASWRQRQHRILAVERLDCGLFIHAEHRRMLRRVQVPPNYLGRVDLEVRVVRGQIAFHSMRFDPVFSPDAIDRHVRDAIQFSGQLARGPMRRAIGRLAFARPGQYARFDPIAHLVALAPRVARKQPAEPIGRKALAPTINVAVAAVELSADLGPRMGLREQQDQPRASRRIGPTVPRTRLSLQFHSLILRQFHHALHRHRTPTISGSAST